MIMMIVMKMVMQTLNITARVKIDVNLIIMIMAMVTNAMQTLNMTARTKID